MRPPNAAALRRRWLDPASRLPLLADVATFLERGTVENGRVLDLRGAEIGNQEELANFRLAGRTFVDLDVSFGRGALIIANATVRHLVAERFRFDRASYLRRSKLSGSTFLRSHLHLDAEDVEFSESDFGESTFAGGSNEYGFRRCKFVRCSFAAISWRNTYFRACSFDDCNFEGGRITNTIIAGVRIYGGSSAKACLSGNELRSVYIDEQEFTGAA